MIRKKRLKPLIHKAIPNRDGQRSGAVDQPRSWWAVQAGGRNSVGGDGAGMAGQWPGYEKAADGRDCATIGRREMSDPPVG
jgi:hypothetical protein